VHGQHTQEVTEEPPQRFFTAVDISNLWRSCRDEFGDDARVDFQVLGSMIPAMHHPSPVTQHLVAYLVSRPGQKHQALAGVLRSFGYSVRERYMRHDKVSDKPTRTDWDVGITIDAIDLIETYDTFVLVSGDGDFVMLLNYLKQRGKKTVVLTFEKSASRQLYTTADCVITLAKNIVFNGTSPL
jgi:uncharacterized LabA/DUF88 family protein